MHWARQQCCPGCISVPPRMKYQCQQRPPIPCCSDSHLCQLLSCGTANSQPLKAADRRSPAHNAHCRNHRMWTGHRKRSVEVPRIYAITVKLNTMFSTHLYAMLTLVSVLSAYCQNLENMVFFPFYNGGMQEWLWTLYSGLQVRGTSQKYYVALESQTTQSLPSLINKPLHATSLLN